jgi:hypothetical protein
MRLMSHPDVANGTGIDCIEELVEQTGANTGCKVLVGL